METKRTLTIAGCGLLIAGLASLLGFQGGAEKSGVVDLNRVIQQSNFGKENTDRLNAELKRRRELMDFVATYRVLTAEQAQKLRELMLKAAPTDAEKTETERLKQTIQDSDKKRNDLSQKATLSDDERATLRDFSLRAQTMDQVLERWNQEFSEELGQLESDARNTTLARARESLKTVAKNGNFTIVFESSVVPYGANDLTDDTIKSMNAKK